MHPGFLLINEPHSLLPLAESLDSTLFLWVSTPLPEWVIAIYWLIVSIVTRPHVTWWHNTLSDTMEQTGVDQSDKNNETLMKLLRYYTDLKLQNWYNGGQLYVTIQSMLSWWTSTIHAFGFISRVFENDSWDATYNVALSISTFWNQSSDVLKWNVVITSHQAEK